MTQYRTICLILAAGSSTRFLKNNQTQLNKPKQYTNLASKPIIRHTVENFLQHKDIDAVSIAHHPDHLELLNNALVDLNHLPHFVGGTTRQESVLLGLKHIKNYNPKNILIHDAARPFTDSKIITNIISSLDTKPGVIPAIKVSDTIKECNGNKITSTIPRDNLYQAQTPQGFRYKELLQCYQKISIEDIRSKFTDDASIFEYFDKEVNIIDGSKSNIKITSPEDLVVAEALYDRYF